MNWSKSTMLYLQHGRIQPSKVKSHSYELVEIDNAVCIQHRRIQPVHSYPNLKKGLDSHELVKFKSIFYTYMSIAIHEKAMCKAQFSA
jgi:hypothetical protein